MEHDCYIFLKYLGFQMKKLVFQMKNLVFQMKNTISNQEFFKRNT